MPLPLCLKYWSPACSWQLLCLARHVGRSRHTTGARCTTALSAPALLLTPLQLNMPEDEVAETVRHFRKSHLSELQALAQIRCVSAVATAGAFGGLCSLAGPCHPAVDRRSAMVQPRARASQRTQARRATQRRRPVVKEQHLCQLQADVCSGRRVAASPAGAAIAARHDVRGLWMSCLLFSLSTVAQVPQLLQSTAPRSVQPQAGCRVAKHWQPS